MPKGDGVLSAKQWAGIYGVALLALAILIVWTGTSSKPIKFQPIDGQLVIDVLTPLFLVALFLERAQEVFISAWREMGRKPLETTLEKEKGETSPTADDIKKAEDALAAYKSTTGRISFLVLLSAGVIISLVGLRSLESFVDLGRTGWTDTQGWWFSVVDIVLTGGLIGGGSDGIHKLVSVVTDFLDSTRKKIKQP